MLKNGYSFSLLHTDNVFINLEAILLVFSNVLLSNLTLNLLHCLQTLTYPHIIRTFRPSAHSIIKCSLSQPTAGGNQPEMENAPEGATNGLEYEFRHCLEKFYQPKDNCQLCLIPDGKMDFSRSRGNCPDLVYHFSAYSDPSPPQKWRHKGDDKFGQPLTAKVLAGKDALWRNQRRTPSDLVVTLLRSLLHHAARAAHLDGELPALCLADHLSRLLLHVPGVKSVFRTF